ncbi:MAG: spermidine/putrescine ABC transporter substrate-binding protein [Planctomycetaceae bacterium]
MGGDPWMFESLHARVSRRGFLRAVGGLAGAAALSPALAACASTPAGPFDGDPAGVVDFANWPLYIDKAKDAQGHPEIPSLNRFTEVTGILVNYREVIPDAEVFFRRIQPYLAAGRPTGWDVMVITNGITLTKLVERNELLYLPSDRRPNFDRNAAALVKDPPYDPGNRYTMAWQSGITGIAYNPQLTGGPVDSLAELFTREFEGKVGMFGDPVDLPNLAMMAAGIDPETSTPRDWNAAAAMLRRQRDRGIVKAYYNQNYLNALANGDVAVSMAWSGDIFQANAGGKPEGLKFVVPREGALLWTDNMCIPEGALHPVDAIRLMDFVYRPDIAAMIAAYVAYVTPVPTARDQILKMAQAKDVTAEQATSLQQIATSPLVFPSEEDEARLKRYRELKTDEELAQWQAAFGEFYL